MRVLITGANGQVGWELARQARLRGMDTLALDRQTLDITDRKAVNAAIQRWEPHLVINPAAYTAVDNAEQDSERAFAINRDGAANLAVACAACAIPLFQLSTDYVFDGSRVGSYEESDPVAPLGVYGLSKWQGEEAVRAALEQHLVIRISWVFGVHGHNFVKTMLRLGAEREQLRVVADQSGCPTAARDIAAVLLDLAERHGAGEALAWGTYHYCGTPPTTWYGFATEIFRIARDLGAKTPVEVAAISTAEYPTPARRPSNSVLNSARIEQMLGVSPRPWQDALGAMIETLLNDAGEQRV